MKKHKRDAKTNVPFLYAVKDWYFYRFLFSPKIDYPAASSGVLSSVQGRHSVLDTESSQIFWIPASAGMTNARQAEVKALEAIQNYFYPLG